MTSNNHKKELKEETKRGRTIVRGADTLQTTTKCIYPSSGGPAHSEWNDTRNREMPGSQREERTDRQIEEKQDIDACILLGGTAFRRG